MSLYHRGNIWWCRFTAPSGKRIFESTGTEDRLAAQQFEDLLKAEYWRVQKLGERPNYTWQQAVTRWLDEQAHKKSIADDIHHLRRLDADLRKLYLNDIDRQLIDTITSKRLRDGVMNSTVNRMLEVLRAILRRAERQWEWIERAPHVRMLPEPKRRIRWITREEADRLLDELPDHLRDMVAFTLSTGLREANVCGLTWQQIDLQRRVAWFHADEMKGKKEHAVPLNNDAVVILRQQLGKHSTWVFTYNCHRVNSANNHAWRKALKRAGIEDFRWHDLRHTWASWHIQAGTPLHILQELGGWESVEMVRRYAHLSADHLSEFAGNVQRKIEIINNKTLDKA
jgi:integrase